MNIEEIDFIGENVIHEDIVKKAMAAQPAEELLADLAEDTPELFSPYNTNAVFRNGELLELHSWSYPWGPDGLPDD